jgi:hypothetical protein
MYQSILFHKPNKKEKQEDDGLSWFFKPNMIRDDRYCQTLIAFGTSHEPWMSKVWRYDHNLLLLVTQVAGRLIAMPCFWLSVANRWQYEDILLYIWTIYMGTLWRHGLRFDHDVRLFWDKISEFFLRREYVENLCLYTNFQQGVCVYIYINRYTIYIYITIYHLVVASLN